MYLKEIVLFTIMIIGSLVNSEVNAQSKSSVGINTVFVPTGDAPWLTDWYNMHQSQYGAVFNPQIEVGSYSEVMDNLNRNPLSVALLPASVNQFKDENGIYRSDAGVAVCLAMISSPNSSIRSLGDLHTLKDRPIIAVSSDVRHIVDLALKLYKLTPQVEIVVTDNEGSLTATKLGNAALGFVSTAPGKKPLFLTKYDGTINLLEIPLPIIRLERERTFFAGSFPLSEAKLFGHGLKYESLCEPISAVTTEVSRYKRVNFNVVEVEHLSTQELGLFQRVYAALNRLLNNTK